jgi:hypothetical protein
MELSGKRPVPPGNEAAACGQIPWSKQAGTISNQQKTA